VRIVTWNVNAVNPRLAHLLSWLTATSPDVVCLQETKCFAHDFPTDAFADLGYTSVHLGDGRWNGVAILSKHELTDVRTGLPDQPAFEGKVEPRAIAATTAGLRVWSLYVPNGREVGHPHYDYKLEWLDALVATAGQELPAHPGRLLLLGDFNIAPTDADVWSREAFEGSTHVTAAERERLTGLHHAGLREILPRPLKYETAFTFWDYRQLAFPKNRGMRIDLAYAAPALAERVADAYVDREARKGKGTSDHAPIVIDLQQEDA
jgi:exodeoxyribonuclease-3